ncbi:MAG: hypothetical protein J2P46_20040 [Zavarzinella sp.]|nr:hypothetical protein [Zavarzinella sp.]
MQTIQTRERTGTDGTLTVRVPLGQPDTEFDIVLVVQPKLANGPLPPWYYDLLGSIDDETFMVHPQPPLPPPVDVE